MAMSTMHRKYNYNSKNPLFKFYEELCENNKGKRVNNWRIMAELTGIPLQTLFSIARKDYTGVLRISLANYVQLKDTINVDMLSFDKE